MSEFPPPLPPKATPPPLPAPVYIPSPKRSKRRTFALVAGIVAAVAVSGIAQTARHKITHDKAPASYALTYQATGTSCGSVTMATPSGTRQVDPVCPGKIFQFIVGPNDHAYFSIQNNEETGSVGCKITLDSTVIAAETSTGAYVIATCTS